MNASDFDINLRIRPWKPELPLVPHLTIETNMNCNFRCRSCYNHNRSFVKSIDQIREEIDIGLQRRKADTITILGGEPSLHEDLLEVIRYIKTKGVVAQMLTNGYVFLSDHTKQRLLKLKENGLDRVLLHIDDGQEAYPDPMASIKTFLEVSSSIRLLTTISWTVYRGRQGQLPALIREFSHYPYFDGFLSVLEKSIDEAVDPDQDATSWPDLDVEYRHLRDELGIQPSFYLPSNLSDRHVTWLVYLYYINSRTGKAFHVSPRLSRLYQKAYLRLKGRELFGVPPMRSFRGLSLLILGLAESLTDPRRIGPFVRLISNSAGLRDIRYQYLALQDGPEFKEDHKAIAMCYHCPDATIRNGILAPVCMADRISPLPGSEPPDGALSEDLLSLVNEHLKN